MYDAYLNLSYQGGPGGPDTPAPVKTSQKIDGRCVGLQVSRVIGPPLDKFLGCMEEGLKGRVAHPITLIVGHTFVDIHKWIIQIKILCIDFDIGRIFNFLGRIRKKTLNLSFNTYDYYVCYRGHPLPPPIMGGIMGVSDVPVMSPLVMPKCHFLNKLYSEYRSRSLVIRPQHTGVNIN